MCVLRRGVFVGHTCEDRLRTCEEAAEVRKRGTDAQNSRQSSFYAASARRDTRNDEQLVSNWPPLPKVEDTRARINSNHERRDVSVCNCVSRDALCVHVNDGSQDERKEDVEEENCCDSQRKEAPGYKATYANGQDEDGQRDEAQLWSRDFRGEAEVEDDCAWNAAPGGKGNFGDQAAHEQCAHKRVEKEKEAACKAPLRGALR